MERKRLGRYVVLVAGCALLAVMVPNITNFGMVRVGTWSTVYIGGWRSVPFDERVWRANEPVGQGFAVATKWDNRRACMVDDVIANRLHTGMTRKEVAAVLGKCDAELDGRTQYYLLLGSPRWDQKLIARVCVHTWNPVLALTYDRASRLKSIRIE